MLIHSSQHPIYDENPVAFDCFAHAQHPVSARAGISKRELSMSSLAHCVCVRPMFEFCSERRSIHTRTFVPVFNLIFIALTLNVFSIKIDFSTHLLILSDSNHTSLINNCLHNGTKPWHLPSLRKVQAQSVLSKCGRCTISKYSEFFFYQFQFG